MRRDLKVPNNIKRVPAENICLKRNKKTKKQLCERREVIAWKVA